MSCRPNYDPCLDGKLNQIGSYAAAARSSAQNSAASAEQSEDFSQAYFNTSSTVNSEDASFDLPANKGIKLTGGGANSRWGVWSNRTDINSLIGGSNFGSLLEGGTNGQLVLGINSNDTTDKFSILSNAGGSTVGIYDTVATIIDRVGNITAGGTVRWNPSSSENPTTNGQVLLEFTSNTQIKVKARGSDGIVRSAILTLS
jgi:hypothetical protein